MSSSKPVPLWHLHLNPLTPPPFPILTRHLFVCSVYLILNLPLSSPQGNFDLPDRLFHSVKDAWLSAAQTNMADVKELIPEFFYLPEFLTNHNKFEFGTKQNGDVIGDVCLPTWAKGDPREFIRLHRKVWACIYCVQRSNAETPPYFRFSLPWMCWRLKRNCDNSAKFYFPRQEPVHRQIEKTFVHKTL